FMREDGIVHVIRRAQKSFLLSCYGQKDDGAFRFCLQCTKRLGDLQDSRRAAGVVEGAIIYRVAGSVRHTYAEVIPVRRVNDNFLRAGRARNLSDDVVRVVLLRHCGERGGGTNPQRTALISGLFSCGKFFCEVKSRSFKELPGCGERKPTFHGAGDLLGFEIQLGGIPAGLQDTERIAGGCVFVYHETSFGALPGSFLKFVSPAAIVGHGASFEKGGVVRSEARVRSEEHTSELQSREN